MHFVDEAKIYIQSGKGGAGAVSFRREKFIEYGGPDGGNGGKGGDIIVRANPDLNTLIDFRYHQHFKAKDGSKGSRAQKTGAAGEDMIIEVPLWTQIFNAETSEMLVDMDEPDQEKVLLRGGDGGLGNVTFKTSTNRAPRRSTQGWPQQELWVWLKLKLLADVGLVGLPNAGKSTFFASVTAANPKIAAYPFTTLKPQLGVAYLRDSSIVFADLPGLLEGASEGVGLGHKFLKHLERCRVLLHVVDVSDPNYAENYLLVRQELEKYGKELSEKKEVIYYSKRDLLQDESLQNSLPLFKLDDLAALLTT